MTIRRIAAVDIGTNTLLMTIADVSTEGTFTYIDDIHSIARLGQNVDASKIIQPEARQRAVAILHTYRQRCKELEVDEIRAVGTSCLRDAANQREVCAEFETVLGTPIDILSGDEEARLCFIGTIENENPTTILDIGGGSTEIISGKGNSILFRTSLDVGAVRLTERYFQILPASSEQIQKATDEIQTHIQTIDKNQFFSITAVAGTPTTLAAVSMGLTSYNSTAIHNYTLSMMNVDSIARQLLRSTLDEIITIPGVHRGRADILPAGTLILYEILNYAGQRKCTVSIKGLRYGILKEMASRP
jgi:exopolyphosphatase/guanosine-5'-triphosphate,3'-diphosphate pyrophosphatase